MIHNATNLVSKSYKPSYIHSKNIVTSVQNIEQNLIPYIIIESDSNGINSIINEITNGLRLRSENIPTVLTSYVPPIYDVPKSLFSVSELMTPEDVGDIDSDTVTYNL